MINTLPILAAQTGETSSQSIIAIVAIVVFLLGTAALLFSRYKMCPSDKILIVYHTLEIWYVGLFSLYYIIFQRISCYLDSCFSCLAVADKLAYHRVIAI